MWCWHSDCQSLDNDMTSPASRIHCFQVILFLSYLFQRDAGLMSLKVMAVICKYFLKDRGQRLPPPPQIWVLAMIPSTNSMLPWPPVRPGRPQVPLATSCSLRYHLSFPHQDFFSHLCWAPALSSLSAVSSTLKPELSPVWLSPNLGGPVLLGSNPWDELSFSCEWTRPVTATCLWGLPLTRVAFW